MSTAQVCHAPYGGAVTCAWCGGLGSPRMSLLDLQQGLRRFAVVLKRAPC